MLPPDLRPATSPAWPPVGILCTRCFSVRLTRKPPRVDMLPVGCAGGGFFHLGSRVGLGLLLRQLTRMHHHKTERLRDDASVALLHLHLAEHAVPMPAAGRLVLRPPRLLYQEGEGGVLLAPRFEFLTHCTGARDQGH
jgi:hypothetical protein